MAEYTWDGPNEYYDETSVLPLLDPFGNLATATVMMGARSIQPEFVAANTHDWTSAQADDVLDTYCLHLNMQMFLDDALIGWGELSEDIESFGDVQAGSWIEPVPEEQLA